MPFLASVAARQAGIALANASQLPQPTLGASTSASAGYTFSITNYDSSLTYSFSVTDGGSASQVSGAVTVTGLGNGVTATCTVTVSKAGFLSDSASTTGTSFSQLDAPTFGASTGASGGYTFAISNYNASNTYSFSVTNGGSASQASGTVTVTGLANATTATCTVTANRAGFVQNSANTTGTSFSQLDAPHLSSSTSAAGGYTFIILNYSTNNTYSFSVGSGGSATQSSGTVTVTGLGSNVTASCAVTASRAGFVQNSTTTSGTSYTQLATPTFTNYQAGGTPGRYKYNITIANYDSSNTYTLSTSSGSATRSGSVITVNGSADNQSITLYVTASRAGFTNSSQASYTNSTPDAPCPAGTYLYGPVYYPTVGGVANGCGYNGVCDGNYGIGLAFVSGPCATLSGGDYCAGCSPAY